MAGKPANRDGLERAGRQGWSKQNLNRWATQAKPFEGSRMARVDECRSLCHLDGMTQALDPISPQALAQSLDTLRGMPALLASHAQANDFEGGGFYKAIHVVRQALARLDRQSLLLYLEHVLEERSIEILRLNDSGQESLLVGVWAQDVDGNDIDEEELEDVADAINTRMDDALEQFVRDFLMDPNIPITRARLKVVAEEAVGPDFTAAREAEALGAVLPGGDGREAGKPAKARM